MAVLVDRVTCPPFDSPTLHPDLVVGTGVLAELVESDALARLGDATRLARRGGHTPRAMFALGVTLLLAPPHWGIRPFIERHKKALRRVAAVADLSSLPSSGAMSRGLGRITLEHVEQLVSTALPAPVGFADLMNHDAVQHRDAYGRQWHVVDIDPTVQAYRQRDLPTGEDLPEPERIAPGVPGYTGHHRGEVRVRHVPVQHAGSGLWLTASVRLDEQEKMSSFTGRSVGAAVRVLENAGVERARVIVRGDGEFGSAGVLRAIADQKVRFVSRLSRYHLLRRQEFAPLLKTTVWSTVGSSTGHEKCEATDLGMVVLHASKGTADEGCEPVEARVVVARRSSEASHRMHGVQLGAYHYELFATDLGPSEWPAEDIVALYHGRAVIENRFAEGNRELGLSRTFSYHAPGQAWMRGVGLYLWNEFICRRFRQDPETVGVSDEQRRRAVATSPSCKPPLPAPEVCEGTLDNADFSEGESHDDVSSPDLSSTHGPTSDESTQCIRASAQGSPNESSHAVFHGISDADRNAVRDVLEKRYRDVLRADGWRLHEEKIVLLCPAGKRLFPFSVARMGKRRPKPQLIIRTDVGACDGCPLRQGCFSSTRPNQYKQISRSLLPEEDKLMRDFLAKHSPGRRPRRMRPRSARPRPASSASDTEPTPNKVDNKVDRPATRLLERLATGPFQMRAPTFAPAEFRADTRRQLESCVIDVAMGARTRRRLKPRRSRRRLSWTERRNRRVSCRDVVVRIQQKCCRGVHRPTG